MNRDVPTRPTVTVLYDPLCGWCYGAAPALRRLATEADLAVELLPTGSFAGAHARPMDARFAEYAWANDQRIRALTGQPFSTRYRDQVLGDRRASLDSGPATSALTAVARTSPAHELRALEAIQAARFDAGDDVTDLRVLDRVLRGLGLAEAAAQLTSAVLATAVAARIAAARDRLRAVGTSGVPTVIVENRTGPRVVPNDLLYGPFESLIQYVRVAININHGDRP